MCMESTVKSSRGLTGARYAGQWAQIKWLDVHTPEYREMSNGLELEHIYPRNGHCIYKEVAQKGK